MMMQKRYASTNIFLRLSLLLLLLLLALVACGGSDEAIEESGEADTSELDETSDSEAIADGDIGATGSEEDSGEIPPTPEPGSKVASSRATPNPASADLLTDNPSSSIARIESGETAVALSLDLLLLIDTTGSMADELSHLQASLPDFLTRLTEIPNVASLRLGMVTYGDQGKQESVQAYDFSENSTLFAENVASLTAVGGGDYPEAMNLGFYQAVNGMDWQTDATKILILLGDAPPQANNPDESTYEETGRLASAQNIIIFTIGSDGLDAASSAIYEQVAQNGNGRFYFISDMPDTDFGRTTAVYPMDQLTIILTEIVQEVLDTQVP
jgi:hypothetical protein